jgi:AcrR family transcriptional regulator
MAKPVKTKGRLGTSPKGQDTRNKIVLIARQILVDEGYEGFVFRKIAKQADITAGNLQYYFKTKRELLSAVLLEEMHRYEESYKEILTGSSNQKSAIKNLIDFLFLDICKGPTSNIWHVAWALSDHDKELEKFVDDWYLHYLENLSAMFKEIVPELNEDKANRAAVMLTALIDGLTVQLGNKQSSQAIYGDLKKSVTTVLDFLLEV